MVSSALNETILTLYRHCRDMPAADFKGWAMETVQQAVPFDSGVWVTANIVSESHNSVYLFRQPWEMIENYLRNMSISGDALAQAVIANPGRTIVADGVIPRSEFIHSPSYLNHCRLYGMEHTLCTSHVAPVTHIVSAISFYRADPNTPFNETDRLTKELLTPHLIEAMRINLFS